MATERGSEKTICPSEVARKLFPNDWRKHMEDVRSAAFLLQKEGLVAVSQKGKLVVSDEVKGPIRIRIFPQP
ncbi:MAG: DUF3253 domain-containing protein [Flavobacteriales bacterium]|nr:MAG: DUF3253 domain-containing protein [Flavobacteriales bacterium]